MSEFDKWWVEFSAGEKHLEMADKHVAMAAWDYQQARIGALTAEVEEQARLLGASGSREAELMARVEALEKRNKQLISICCQYDVPEEALQERERMSDIAAVFVYEHKNTGEVRVRWPDDAAVLDADDSWLHIGSLEPRAYLNHLLTEYPALVRKMKSEY